MDLFLCLPILNLCLTKKNMAALLNPYSINPRLNLNGLLIKTLQLLTLRALNLADDKGKSSAL